MKKDNHFLDEELPPELEAKILRSAAPLLFQRKQLAQKNSFWLKSIFGSLALATIIAVIFVPKIISKNEKQTNTVSTDLLENLDLLQIMPQIENEDLLLRAKIKSEKAERQWPRKNQKS